MSRAAARIRGSVLAIAIAAMFTTPAARAQAMDPHMHMPMPMPAPAVKQPVGKKPVAKKPAVKKPAAKKPVATKATAPAPVEPATMDHPAMDSAAMQGMEGMEGMEGMQGMDHSTMDHAAAAPSAVTTLPRTPIPEPSDADRAAARAPAGGHVMDASRVHSLVLFDQLEAWDARPGSGQAWRAQAWIGGDIQRLWLRSEGERIDGDSERAELEILYGRAVSPWWTVLVGIRHDVDPGTAQDFAAIGIMGTAPYKFDVAATAYVGSGGQAALRLEGEYALLLTQRLVLQPHLEINAFAREDAAHGVGSGLGTVETGLRLRYQVTPRIAPYIGIVREQAFGGTADLRRAAGEDAGDTRVVAGLWFWF